MNGQALGSSSTPYPELTNNGIECDIVEQLTFHTHTKLTMIVDEKQHESLLITRSTREPLLSGNLTF